MKQCIVILVGGPSNEHEVSLKSGEQIFQNIDREKYDPTVVVIDRNLIWNIDGLEYSETGAIFWIKQKNAIVFIALHGEYGEDGTVQALFEQSKIKFIGSSSICSKVAFDKAQSQEVFKKHGLHVPNTLCVGSKDVLPLELYLPAIVKPSQAGSSFGVSVVQKMSDLKNAVDHALLFDSCVLIQEMIIGAEVTCGILRIEDKDIALPPTLIKATGDFFDFASKYTKGGAIEVTPAPVSSDIYEAIQSVALTAHRALKCYGLSRTDMIIRENGEIVVLETNTIPGMTSASLLPQQAVAVGLDYQKLINTIIKSVR